MPRKLLCTCGTCTTCYGRKKAAAYRADPALNAAIRERTKQWIEKRREEFLNNYELVCIRCGESHPATIQFHHREPLAKKFEISRAIRSGIALDRIAEEIEKCDILCANCHKIIHWEEKHVR